MFARIIHDQASPTEEANMSFNESLQIAFPNNMLISKFHMNAANVNRAARKRGAGPAELVKI